jgi:formiminotetrahydrofolate cyclodeaminase
MSDVSASSNADGIASQPIREFLERLASDSPTPGGGAVAALAAAAGAALIAMVANLTVDKQSYEAAWEQMRELRGAADAARAELLALADRDAMAFDAVMDAFRMPKATEAEKSVRAEAIQMAFAGAAAVPMQIAGRAAALLPGARDAVELGNANAASDGVSAAHVLFAAVECAAANVEINASSLKDEAKRDELRAAIDVVRSDAREDLDDAVRAFGSKMG